MLSTIASRSVRITRMAPKGFAMRGLATTDKFKNKVNSVPIAGQSSLISFSFVIPLCRDILLHSLLESIDNEQQEKVEEERFVKEQEKKFFEKKRSEAAAVLKAEELKHFEDVIAPAMAKLEAELKKTGDKVSDDGLEAIARWKTA